ncbi:MAG: hypothetical protein ACRD63_08035, partial [Pyrinomonadaceae bacterium]
MNLLAHFRQRTPSGRKQTLFAAGLGLLGFILLVRFIFPIFSAGSSDTPNGASSTTAPNNTSQATKNSNTASLSSSSNNEGQKDSLIKYEPIKFDPGLSITSQSHRDLFSYYVPPPPPPPTPVIPTFIISSVSPQSVYVHSGSFTLN